MHKRPYMLRYLKKGRLLLQSELQEEVKNQEVESIKLSQQDILDIGKGNKSPYIKACIGITEDLLCSRITLGMFKTKAREINKAFSNHEIERFE